MGRNGLPSSHHTSTWRVSNCGRGCFRGRRVFQVIVVQADYPGRNARHYSMADDDAVVFLDRRCAGRHRRTGTPGRFSVYGETGRGSVVYALGAWGHENPKTNCSIHSIFGGATVDRSEVQGVSRNAKPADNRNPILTAGHFEFHASSTTPSSTARRL